MDVVKSLKPGKNATKRVVERHGDDLIAVRYRQDTKRQISNVTVELIIEPKQILPKTQTHKPTRTTASVFVRNGFYEKELQAAVRRVGGKWQQEEKLWLVNYKAALHLGLQERIVNK